MVRLDRIVSLRKDAFGAWVLGLVNQENTTLTDEQAMELRIFLAQGVGDGHD